MTHPSAAFRLLAVVGSLHVGLACGPAMAVLPSEKLTDPVLESRADTLSKSLRCVVCQNQNIDDSAAPLAADMRIILRERIAAGDSDQAAVNYLVERYGNYVLLKPPFQPNTWLLWISPYAVLLIASVVTAVQLKRRAAQRVRAITRPTAQDSPVEML